MKDLTINDVNEANGELRKRIVEAIYEYQSYTGLVPIVSINTVETIGGLSHAVVEVTATIR